MQTCVAHLLRNSCRYAALQDWDKVCTTNAIESVDARIRRAVKARGHFPNEQVAWKCVYMAIMSLDPTGKGQARWTMPAEDRTERLRPHLRRPPLRSPSLTPTPPLHGSFDRPQAH